MEFAFIILATIGLYGDKPGEMFGYEEACRRVFGEIGSGWALFHGSQNAWMVIGEARNYPLLTISPSREEVELQFNYLQGCRSRSISTKSVTTFTKAVGTDGDTLTQSSTQTHRKEVSSLSLPNGATAIVNSHTDTGEKHSYLLEIEVNPTGSGVGGRSWKQPTEESASKVLAVELAKIHGIYLVSPMEDDSNGNPDVRILFENREVLVQHTSFEPPELKLALTRRTTAFFEYTDNDLRTFISKRLEAKRQDARLDRTLVLDAGFCIPLSTSLIELAQQLVDKETGPWGEIWLLVRLDRLIHKLR